MTIWVTFFINGLASVTYVCGFVCPLPILAGVLVVPVQNVKHNWGKRGEASGATPDASPVVVNAAACVFSLEDYVRTGTPHMG